MEEIENTLMLFSQDDIEIYNKLSVNNRNLCQFENVCQVWFLIIKKSLFEKEYQVALSMVVLLLEGLGTPQRPPRLLHGE